MNVITFPLGVIHHPVGGIYNGQIGVQEFTMTSLYVQKRMCPKIVKGGYVTLTTSTPGVFNTIHRLVLLWSTCEQNMKYITSPFKNVEGKQKLSPFWGDRTFAVIIWIRSGLLFNCTQAQHLST